MLDLDTLDFGKGGGLVTVVTQDARTGDVLMVAHADREALERTLATGEMYYRSRTRGLWHKGGTSGNVQRVVSLAADCDGDAVLARVDKAGPSCHTGAETCFGDGRLDALAHPQGGEGVGGRGILIAGLPRSPTRQTLEVGVGAGGHGQLALLGSEDEAGTADRRDRPLGDVALPRGGLRVPVLPVRRKTR